MVSKGYSTVDFAREFLIVPNAKCSRHCSRPTRFVPILEKNDQNNSAILIGAYACPDNYVTRVVYFADRPDQEWFERFLREQVGDLLRSRDIRYATRHGWELGRDAEEKIGLIAPAHLPEAGKATGVTQFYWTFYPQSDEEKKRGTFLCSKEDGGCGRRLFVKEISDEKSKLCSQCESDQDSHGHHS
ncbi:MAG TPA: hypothetical protein VFF30_13525 [Nitrososphaerales archaeon]|nr:hypothetical protein [Nitrososphaerales archaeon]